jgi:integrase
MRNYPSSKDLAKLTKRGRYAVGNNVYLQISEWGTRSWLLRYRVDGRATHMGLGAFDLLTLAEARERGHQARRQLLDGVDPLKAKRAAKRQRLLAHAHAKTFEECALAYITAHEAGWRGDHSRQQWSASLGKYVLPKIGDLPVADVDLACVLSVLEPIWSEVPETARRVRNRIELILGWAAARGLRQGDNPARWRGLLENLLSEQRRAQAVNHLAAVPYQQIGAFMEKLRSQEGIAARALEFLILTASRSSEALGAKWSEIDGATWTVPAGRMKAHKEHRVPLSRRAVALLASLPHDGDFVFPAPRAGGAPHQQTLSRELRRLGVKATVHGFRSSFRTWAGERTSFANHVIEISLAHTIGSAVERAYSRGDLLDQRSKLMEAWAEFCDRGAGDSAAGAVVAIGRAS